MSSMYDASVDVLFVMFYRLTVQNTHRPGALFINRQQTTDWIFTQKNLSSIYRYKPILPLIEFRRNSTLQYYFFKTFRSR